MEDVFTRLVRSFPGQPDEALVVEAWQALARVLQSELRRRGLWTAPPSYLGIVGWDRWGQGWSQHGAADGGALDELVADCFSYNFVERLRSLLVQLESKTRIDGLVRLNVRHFVFERQRRHDPVGFRVFEIVREAVEAGIRRGVLSTDHHRERIANTTILAVGAHHEAPVADRDALADIVRRWNDALLPDLLVVVGRHRTAVVESLVARLVALDDDGVSRFRFKDLIDPLKNDARERWGTFMAQAFGRTLLAQDDNAMPDGVAEPDASFEERQRFEWLASEVASSIEGIDTDHRHRDYLARLWTFLAPTEADTSSPMPAPIGRQLSNRRLGDLLDIPRERLPALMTTLGELLTRARANPTNASLQER